MDALAQVVHVVKMLAPALVDDLQQQEALDVAHHLGRELGLALLVLLLGDLLEHRLELLAVGPHGVDVRELGVRREHLRHSAQQAADVPSSTKSPAVYSSTMRSIRLEISERD